ncbi:hypothetical protein Sste5346_004486 [Sporothrix stenoceras]|uniref:Uncharacterized protein n=1 Tax=Sporothrix stenoceras TaxID=5173 RepID=A0ABR3Z9G5_9PEZI
MFASKFYKTIEDWTLFIAMTLSYLPLTATVCTFIYYVLTTIIPNAVYDYFSPVLSEFGLIETKTPKIAETTTEVKLKHTNKLTRIIHNSDDRIISTRVGTDFFSTSRTDIIRYRAPLTTLSIEKRGRAYYDHDKPRIFSTDEELAQAEKHIKEEDKTDENGLYFCGKFALKHSYKTHIGCNVRCNRRAATKDMPKTANMPKTIQARNAVRDKVVKDYEMLQTRGIRTERMSHTYTTGCFILNAPSKLKDEIYSLADEGTDEEEEGDMNLYLIDMEENQEHDVLTEGLPFADFDDFVETKIQKAGKKGKKENKKKKQQLAHENESRKQPAKDKGKSIHKKALELLTKPTLTYEEAQALDDAALDEELVPTDPKQDDMTSSNATTSKDQGQKDVTSFTPTHVATASPGLDDPFVTPTANTSAIVDVDNDVDRMHMDQSGGAVEIVQNINVVNVTNDGSSYPAGPMEDILDRDSLSIHIHTVQEDSNEDDMEEDPNEDTTRKNRDGDAVMQDSDSESIHTNPPSLTNESASEDDEEEEEDTSFVSHFPTPDAIEYYLDRYSDDVETMSNTSDDSLFTDLSTCFSHLRLDVEKPMPPPETFRVTKANNRQAGMSLHSFFKTRAEKKEQQKAEQQKSPRHLKSKAPEKKPKSPKKALFLASALRTVSPPNKLQKAKEKALMELTTKSNKNLANVDVKMEENHVKTMDLASFMYRLSPTPPSPELEML